jgi:hypothetical protein
MVAMQTSSAIWSRLKFDTPAARSFFSRTSCSKAVQLQQGRLKRAESQLIDARRRASAIS